MSTLTDTYLTMFRQDHTLFFATALARLRRGDALHSMVLILFPIPRGLGGMEGDPPSVACMRDIMEDARLRSHMAAAGRVLLSTQNVRQYLGEAGMRRVQTWATLCSEIRGDRPNVFCEVLENLFGDLEDERARTALEKSRY